MSNVVFCNSTSYHFCSLTFSFYLLCLVLFFIRANSYAHKCFITTLVEFKLRPNICVHTKSKQICNKKLFIKKYKQYFKQRVLMLCYTIKANNLHISFQYRFLTYQKPSGILWDLKIQSLSSLSPIPPLGTRFHSYTTWCGTQGQLYSICSSMFCLTSCELL